MSSSILYWQAGNARSLMPVQERFQFTLTHPHDITNTDYL